MISCEKEKVEGTFAKQSTLDTGLRSRTEAHHLEIISDFTIQVKIGDGQVFPQRYMDLLELEDAESFLIDNALIIFGHSVLFREG